MNHTVALPGSMIWMGIRLSSGSRPQSPRAFRALIQSGFCSHGFLRRFLENPPPDNALSFRLSLHLYQAVKRIFASVSVETCAANIKRPPMTRWPLDVVGSFD